MVSLARNPDMTPSPSSQVTVEVALGARSYPIFIGSGLLERTGELLKDVLPQPRAIIVADENTAPLYADKVAQSLSAAGITSDRIVLPAGEETKSFTVFSRLLEEILALRPERKTALIALGGGVIGDITGFAASVTLRGLPYVQIPTSLLAQVDSSVGGKTAINSAHGKNLVGAFYQPRAVLADVGVLESLSLRELRAGYAEVLKYGLLGDVHFFHWLEEHGEAVLRGDKKERIRAIETSCRAKATIVGADELESADRALLNLGHTFGHALEKATGYGDTLLHGEAVAIGSLMAFDLSMRMGLCPAMDMERVRMHMEDMGLLPDLRSMKEDWNPEKLTNWCYQDKKVEGGALTFVLLQGIGQAFVSREVKAEDVTAVFASYVT